jgi:hypothetical protein
MHTLWAACKVLLSGMQTLENYASHRCYLLHGANADIAADSRLHATCHMPHAACRMPHAACRMPHATCHMPHATCHMPHATCHEHSFYETAKVASGIIHLYSLWHKSRFDHRLSTGVIVIKLFIFVTDEEAK